MEIERAKAVCTTAQTIIDTARVEIKYVEVTGGGEERAKKFFEEEKRPITLATAAKVFSHNSLPGPTAGEIR